jgi:hypothetical protein
MGNKDKSLELFKFRPLKEVPLAAGIKPLKNGHNSGTWGTLQRIQLLKRGAG